MPHRRLAGLKVRHALVDQTVVEADERDVQLHDEEVLLIPRVRDFRRPVRVARQVLEAVDVGLQQEPGGLRRVLDGPGADAIGLDRPVHGIEVEQRRSEVHRAFRVGLLVAKRLPVHRQVVVDELAQECESRGNVVVVADRGASGGIAHRLGEYVGERRRDVERRKVGEHEPEPPLTEATASCRHVEATHRGSMRRVHSGFNRFRHPLAVHHRHARECTSTRACGFDECSSVKP